NCNLAVEPCAHHATFHAIYIDRCTPYVVHESTGRNQASLLGVAMQFRGAHALVTGANRGLGSHFVEALLTRGAERVYAAARRVDALADAVDNHGDRVLPVQLDVTDEET